MSAARLDPGYLAEVDATEIATHAVPGAVCGRMQRGYACEQAAGRPVRRMVIELTPGQARELHEILGRHIQRSLALGGRDCRGDAAIPL